MKFRSNKLAKEICCPVCGWMLDRGTDINNPGRVFTPQPGDIGICCQCGAVHRYTETLGVEPQPLDELTEEEQQDIRRLQKVLNQP